MASEAKEMEGGSGEGPGTLRAAQEGWAAAAAAEGWNWGDLAGLEGMAGDLAGLEATHRAVQAGNTALSRSHK